MDDRANPRPSPTLAGDISTARAVSANGRGRGWRVARRLLGASAVATVAAGAGVATHYAHLLTRSPADEQERPPRPEDHVTVMAVGPDSVVLRGPGGDRRGTWGLATSTGLARVGRIVEASQAGWRRTCTVLDGHIDPGGGLLQNDPVRDVPGDLDPAAVEVVLDSPIGPLPIHEVRGDDLWVIGVHGRAAGRQETFRMLQPVVGAGHSALAVSYRNDRVAPPSPDGRSHLGGTEWEDIVVAMDHARAAGAQRLALVGCSMGGAVVGQVLAHADCADVVGLVLDAPVLDWVPVARNAAAVLGVPPAATRVLLRPAQAIARWRHRVDLRALQLRPELLDAPTLLAHGGRDDLVPVAGSDLLASQRPDTVAYLRVPDAGHVQAWNHDPAAYDAAVRTWLTRLA